MWAWSAACCSVPVTKSSCRVVAVAGALFLPLSAVAQPPARTASHVRPEHALVSFVTDSAHRSPTISTLLNQIEARDITVYIRLRVFTDCYLQGRTSLVATVEGHRYLVIELAESLSAFQRISVFGHELFHAAEIGAEPSIVDARTLAGFYTRVGWLVDDSRGRRSFETAGAAEAGRQSRRDLFARAVQSTEATPSVSHLYKGDRARIMTAWGRSYAVC